MWNGRRRSIAISPPSLDSSYSSCRALKSTGKCQMCKMQLKSTQNRETSFENHFLQNYSIGPQAVGGIIFGTFLGCSVRDHFVFDDLCRSHYDNIGLHQMVQRYDTTLSIVSFPSQEARAPVSSFCFTLHFFAVVKSPLVKISHKSRRTSTRPGSILKWALHNSLHGVRLLLASHSPCSLCSNW